MATIDTPPPDYPPEITGYAEPWIASPGETLAIKVSCTEPQYSHRTVRVIQGVDLAHSPKKELEDITSIPKGSIKGKFQYARSGSYAEVKDWWTSSSQGGLEVSLYFQPYLLKAGHLQSIISTLDVPSSSGFAILINAEGALTLWIGTRAEIKVFPTTFKPVRKRWVAVRLILNGSTFSLALEPIPYVAEKTPPALHVEDTLPSPLKLSSKCSLLLAGSCAETPTSELPFRRVTAFFNGRIDSPMVKSLGPKGRTLVRYDFARNIAEDTILDVSGAGNHGILVNAPTRAIRGYNWDGTETDWTKAKYGYGAIHFHEDDLDDAAWETDFTITVPPNARSGIYAVEVISTNGKTSDMISFIVRPTKETTAKLDAKVALVLSTFTYLAYANEQLNDTSRSSSGGTGAKLYTGSPIPTEDFYRKERRLDLGLSTYDVHNDGSGTVFSSSKRPMLNFKPGYLSYGLARPRELSAESMMVGFLERENIPYDVVTDHDLHLHGVSALAAYNTAITGCHPEYPTMESYNAYEHFAKRGGNLMYLGGNGFYWVTAFDSARPWRIEVRRGEQGVRSYTGDPGERVLSLNGKLGALWRSQGRSSHALFGVAFCSQGRPPGVAYRRTEAGSDPSFKWMFDKIPAGELIGELGLGGGASGDEMDSFDLACGSPLNGVVVATTIGHPDGFGIAYECVSYPILATRGGETSEVRSDMVYYETDAGGAVFSVGSINWFCSLGWDDYENNVAQLTGNIIREFLRREAAGKA